MRCARRPATNASLGCRRKAGSHGSEHTGRRMRDASLSALRCDAAEGTGTTTSLATQRGTPSAIFGGWSSPSYAAFAKNWWRKGDRVLSKLAGTMMSRRMSQRGGHIACTSRAWR